MLIIALVSCWIKIDRLENENANLQYQNIVIEQDLKETRQKLVNLQEETIEKQQNEIIASRGAKRSKVALSAEEFNLVCRVVAAESRGQSAKGQRIIAQCIYDRLTSNCYGKNVTEVVTAPGQFASPFQGDLEDYPAVTYAVYSVFNEGLMPLNADVRVFFNPETSDPGAIKPLRDKYQYITTEGSHEIRGYM
jgi:spore germination cell wall hydrolase CwlJ-like protein